MSNNQPSPLSAEGKDLVWVEISRSALVNNIMQIRKRIGRDVLFCPCVKANAYGHGLVDTARVFLEASADWLSVNALYEARVLRRAGISAPLCILGYVPAEELEEALAFDCRFVLFNIELIDQIEQVAAKTGRTAKIHLKVETGTNRQGLDEKSLAALAKRVDRSSSMELEGISTHFANIEDTTDHSYAEYQLKRFEQAAENLKALGIHAPIRHCANSAATILFPQTHFDMVRSGISCYGMWPSNETFVSYVKERKNPFELKPAFTWKTRISQIKNVPSGEYIGYGCTYRTSHATRLAVLPVGYYDGYDRGIAGGYVLIHGKRAPIRGRICMNMIMVEVTDIPEATLEDEVVLIGRSGDEFISAELFAQWAGTINYEVTTRVNDRIPRFFVDTTG